MFGSYFSSAHQVILALGLAVVVAAIYFKSKNRNQLALLVLTLGALVLRLFAATLDPYLNQWDACFHALVAKRMVEDPFTPMLFAQGILPTATYWTHADIWLHKPPFFLWQMAGSIALFGNEPWAVRIPSVLWLTALVPVTYRIGQLIGGERVGWLSAVLTTTSYYLLELTAGAMNTDHNDAVFIATVGCSWWALLELWNGGGMRWAFVAGFFAACAILTKLFVGLSVFLPWSIAVLMARTSRQVWLQFAFGIIVTTCIVALWFVPLAIRFPEEMAYQWSFKADHLSDAMEGHTGSRTFHFDSIQRLMPPFEWWLVVPAYGYLVWKERRSAYRWFLISLFLSVHVVFAYASTKMLSYTMVLFPLYAVALSRVCIDILDEFIVERFRTGLFSGLCILLGWSALDLYRIQYRHTVGVPPKPEQHWRVQQLDASLDLALLQDMIEDPMRSVVYNVPAIHHIQLMFNSGIEATDLMPESKDVERLLGMGYTVYAMQDGEALSRFPTGVSVITDDVLLFPNIGRPDH